MKIKLYIPLLILSLISSNAFAQGVGGPGVEKPLAGTLILGPDGFIDLSASTVMPAFIYAPGTIAGGDWWNDGLWGGDRGGQRVHMIFGSPTAPITTAGTPVVIGTITGKTTETCDGNSANTGCNSALLVQNKGTAETTMTTSGITSYVETLSTSGLGVGNAQAGNFVAVAGPNAQTGGLGLYAVGMRFAGIGSAYGAEISAWNRTLFNCDRPGIQGIPPVPYDYNRLSRCAALYLAPRGPDQNEDGTPYTGSPRNISTILHMILGNASSRAWEGITFNHFTVEEKTINDQSSSDTVFHIGGQHTNGIYAAPTPMEVTEPPHPFFGKSSITGNTFNDLSNSARSINIGGEPRVDLGETVAHTSAAIWVRQNAGFFGLNTGVAPTALFHMGGEISIPAYTTNGAIIRQALGGVTDTTSPTGIVAGYNTVNMLESVVLNATNPAVTYSTAVNLHVKAPLAGTNVAITQSYALIAGGDVRIDGSLILGSGFFTVADGEIGIPKITPSATAPGVAGAKIALVCGTTAGTGKLIVYGGTSTTPVTITDNIGGGITGC